MTENKYKLNQIYFYLTEGCNLRCRHCWIVIDPEEKKHSNAMLDFSLFKSIIEQAKPLGLTGIKLTGGEPLMHPRIFEMLDFVKNENLRLNVETNGVLCTSEIARKIKACGKVFVSVSLDGSDAETHEWVRDVPGCYQKALEGIRNLVEEGIRPQIVMTIMRHNRNQMESLVRLAESVGASSVKFNIVQAIARGKTMHESRETLDIEELIKIGEWVERDLMSMTKLRIIYSHPFAFCSLSRILSNQEDGCGRCGVLGILGVLAGGSYALCGIGETVPELVFGNAAEEKLEKVWNSAPVLQEIREGMPNRLEGICESCIMKHFCRGLCIAQNYYRSKNLWAPYWYCEEAYNRGLFPESRLLLKRR